MSDPVPVSSERLFAIAYRMLGSVHDAEDAVQEAFLRWERLAPEDRGAIRSPQAWLTTVIGRICLDELGSARGRRESYTGVWLPEPIPGRLDGTFPAGGATDPADTVTLEESVSLAMLVVMEQLTPAERVSFILHDVFGVPFAEIAEAVGRSPDACRQLASTARRHLREQRRHAPDGPERDRVVRAFLHACASGDLNTLVGVLDPQVVLRSDGGGRISAAVRPVAGAQQVARFLLGIMSKTAASSWTARYGTADPRIETGLVNGQTGIVVYLGDRPAMVAGLAVAGDRVVNIDVIVTPDKLLAWE